MKRSALLLIFLLSGCTCFCQVDLNQFNRQRMDINKKGMLVLGSWSAANVITGAIAQSSTEGQAKYFHRMNMYFGSVNLFLSGVAYLSLNRKKERLSFLSTVKEQSTVEKIFLFNTGFDVAYLVAGVYLIEKGRNNIHPAKYKGYGKSLLMQGSALLVFDGVMYILHNKHGKSLEKILNSIQVTGSSVGATIRF